MMLRASTLDEAASHTRSLKKDMYAKFLSQFCKKIQTFNTLGMRSAVLHVPQFYFGGPPYDVMDASIYLRRQLERLGYRATVSDSHGTIHVAWGPRPHDKKNIPIRVIEDGDNLPSLSNLKKTADALRKKYSPSE